MSNCYSWAIMSIGTVPSLPFSSGFPIIILHCKIDQLWSSNVTREREKKDAGIGTNLKKLELTETRRWIWVRTRSTSMLVKQWSRNTSREVCSFRVTDFWSPSPVSVSRRLSDMIRWKKAWKCSGNFWNGTQAGTRSRNFSLTIMTMDMTCAFELSSGLKFGHR